MINKVLLFVNTSGRIAAGDVEKIQNKLEGLGIATTVDESAGYDAVIALGGDGTMLNAAHIAMNADVPLMGINFGTLGYMSGLESGETDMLPALKGDFATESRMLLDIRVERKGLDDLRFTALNEAVVSRLPQSGIAALELLCDGTTVCEYRADGVIIATPTGSSAYALSAGGPIIDTKLDAFCVCPICPHAIGARAMVFSPNSDLTVINKSVSGENAVSADGNLIANIGEGDRVYIKRSEKALKLIRLKKDAFYEVLYRKMR